LIHVAARRIDFAVREFLANVSCGRPQWPPDPKQHAAAMPPGASQ
jgi:hypothetical protein